MNITRAVWETVRRITDEILGVKGLALAGWVTWLEYRLIKSINNKSYFVLSLLTTIGSYVSVHSSRYEARRKFGERERCVRVA